MMSHSPGSVKSAFVCGTICGCSKGWKVKRFCQKKRKITSVYFIVMCTKMSCCNSNIVFTHSNSHLVVMKVRQAYLSIKDHVSKSTGRA